MSELITNATAAHEAADRAVKTLESTMKDEINLAAADIRAKHADQLARLRARRAEAGAALAAAHETRTHEWEGKRVVRKIDNSGPRAWRANFVDQSGVVEICKRGTEFPANLSSYRLPKIGEPFVRIEGKDGKLGKRIANGVRGWKLA